MGTLASGSIDLKSLKIAGTNATGYITDIDDDGIKVHATNNVNSNYVRIDSMGMEIYKSGTSVAKYGDSARIGKDAQAKVVVQASGIDMYGYNANATTPQQNLCHIGYENGNAESGTSIAPYYTFGSRVSGDTIEVNGSTYQNVVGNYSIAEGQNIIARGNCSHAEGHSTIAFGSNSHAEGYKTTALFQYSHAEGRETSANWPASHAEGYGTKTTSSCQHVQGRYNNSSSTNAFEIGNGDDNDTRSNAFEVSWDGDVVAAGGITATGDIAAANGTFSGGITASSGTFSGGITASSGTISSNHVRTSGITALGNITASGEITGATTKTTISSFSSGWAVYDTTEQSPVTLRRNGKVVAISGALKNTSAVTLDGTPVTVFTIPEGYRPSQTVSLIAQGSGTNIFYVRFRPNGNVTFERYRTSTSYSSISSGAWFPFHVTWIMD